MRKSLLFFLLIIVFIGSGYSQITEPKREFRATWVASVSNLDWPSSPGLSTEKQQEQLINILDGLKAAGTNVVIFQIRPECDALYKSDYEPWSYWLTGHQGTPPSPYYDPLEFAIKETHKRGMELHAWFNPYRAVKTVGQYTISPEHVSKQHPDWILQFGSLKILNPGLPQVREFVTDVIMDVVNRYDVDGVHFDDYFYPYEGIRNEDNATFQEYSRGFTNIGDWRRDNVNLLMKMIDDSIKAVKPYVKFGISPFGIWKSGVPQGIFGLDAYSTLYADPIAWLHDRSIDYLTPQLYWKIGGGQDYRKLSAWWADSVAANDRHLYPGHILNSSFSTSELPNQLKIDRENPDILGSVWFRADLLINNSLRLRDSLMNNYYRYPALLPIMKWKDNVPPNAIANLRYEKVASAGRAGIVWDVPEQASDGDTAVRYVVYKFNSQNVQASDLENPANIYDVMGSNVSFPPNNMGSGEVYFVVTALDRNYNESGMSTVLKVVPPANPQLAFPANAAIDQRDTTELQWYFPEGASTYEIMIAKDSTFENDVFAHLTEYKDTSLSVTGLEGFTTYYWKVKSFNPAGSGEYSDVYKFTTGFPAAPELLEPAHATLNVALQPTVIWAETQAATAYRVQLSNSLTFNDATVLVDTSGITDTTFTFSNITLDPGKIYFWRVAASNEYGQSLFSNANGFKTIVTAVTAEKNGVPADYNLAQNYPNPFNPSTEIKFAIPRSGFTSLKVYDVLGNEVAVLVNEDLGAGYYTARFDGTSLSSGLYIYVLQTNGQVLSKKMMMIK